MKLGIGMLEYGFEQIINGPTRVTQTTETQIDLLFTTNGMTSVSFGGNCLLRLWIPTVLERSLESGERH